MTRWAKSERKRTLRTAAKEACYSITSSAMASTPEGTVTRRVLAVLRLIRSSNVVGCSIGKSPALAPLKILSTYEAARRLSQLRLETVGEQPACIGEFPEPVDRWKPVLQEVGKFFDAVIQI